MRLVMPAKLYLIGRTFGRWIVLAEGPIRVKPCGQRTRTSICRCQCGTVSTVVNESLVSGSSKSCGCFRRDKTTALMTEHGHKRRSAVSRTYQSWHNLIQRCTNPANQDFHNYGGRGITVCQRWLDSFSYFLEDMGI